MEPRVTKVQTADVRSAIAHIALSNGDEAEVQRRAQEAAERLGPECLEHLPKVFHFPAPMPKNAPTKLLPLGRWLAANQAACFRVIYEFRVRGLPLLREVAFGPYDWTQAYAIDVLCTLAREGIEAAVIADDLARLLPQLRYEAVLYSFDAYCSLAPEFEVVQHAIDDLIRDWAQDDPRDTLDLLEPLSRTAPSLARKHGSLLRRILRSEGVGTRHPLLDGQVMSFEDAEMWTDAIAAGESPDPTRIDLCAIRAALLLLELIPRDKEASDRLYRWSVTHADSDVRRHLLKSLANRYVRSVNPSISSPNFKLVRIPALFFEIKVP